MDEFDGGDFFADVIVEFLGFFFFCGGLAGIDDEHGGDRVVVFVELGVFGEEVSNGEQQIFALVSDAQFGGGDEVVDDVDPFFRFGLRRQTWCGRNKENLRWEWLRDSK